MFRLGELYFERDAIRPYVLGHFKDMLLATARLAFTGSAGTDMRDR
jgi:uncharacterized protein (DUF1800 family)